MMVELWTYFFLKEASTQQTKVNVGPMQVLSEMGEMETGDLDVEIVR